MKVLWTALIGAVALLLLGLAASLSSAANSVLLNAASARPERPSRITDDLPTLPASRDPRHFRAVQAFVNGIAWSSWGDATASGTGRLILNSSDTRPGHEQPYASQSATVSIVAGGLTACGGYSVYTSYVLTLAAGQAEPRDFGLVSHRLLPCQLHALSYYAGYERLAHTTGDCLFKGVNGQYPPGFGYLSYCRMHWTGWNEPMATGTGIGRIVFTPRGCQSIPGNECDYGIRVKLSNPQWCPEYGLSYTRERLEVFGAGVPLDSEPRATEIAPSVEARVRRMIGRGRPRVVSDRARGCGAG